MPIADRIQTPNFAGNFLNAFTAGRDFRAGEDKRNALSSIGQTAGSGDLQGARQQAFQAGEFAVADQLQAGIDSTDEKTLTAAKLYNADVARAAFNADTPEKWRPAVEALIARYPSRRAELEPFLDNFGAREDAINQGLAIDQMITRQEKKNKPLTLSRGQIAIDPGTGQEIARGLAPKADAPQAIKNLVFPDGTRRAFRADDPRVDQALEQGATVVGQNVTAGSFGDLKGNRADDINEQIGQMQSGRDIIASLRQSINENRARGGAVGTIKGLIQTGAGITADMAELMDPEGTGFLADTAREIEQDIKAGRADSSLAALFDPELPKNIIRQNELAYKLARARKGSGRLNTDDTDNARGDVNITGLQSVDDVLAKLDALEQAFAGAEARAIARLKGETGTSAPTFDARGGRLIRVE